MNQKQRKNLEKLVIPAIISLVFVYANIYYDTMILKLYAKLLKKYKKSLDVMNKEMR